MPSLFDPIRLGAFEAKNRVFMAPLTRGRGTREHVPTPIMVEYYRQRASAGLIITEATGISQEGLGWAYAPGIWRPDQVEAWKPVTAAVHEAGGRMVLQLWHMGRLVHPSFNGGQPPVSASATRYDAEVRTYDDGKQPYATARPLEVSEVPRLLEEYRTAARNAIAAGFDGVQVHGANGYLLDSFLRSNGNFRTDQYGGSVENRARLLVEVTEAVVDAIGRDRVSVRVSPNGDVQGVNDPDPQPLFAHVADEMERIGIAFLEVKEPRAGGTRGEPDTDPVAPVIRARFTGPLVLNSDYGRDDGQAALDAGQADAIAYGRTFLANPDLPRRLAEGLPLNPVHEDTLYAGGAEGYTDYPAAA